MNKKLFEGLTAWLFMISTIAAICWISVSYLMGIYALKTFGNTELLIELSKEAMVTILGVNLMKTVANLFEHNNGGIFGTSIQAMRKEDVADGYEPGLDDAD